MLTISKDCFHFLIKLGSCHTNTQNYNFLKLAPIILIKFCLNIFFKEPKKTYWLLFLNKNPVCELSGKKQQTSHRIAIKEVISQN